MTIHQPENQESSRRTVLKQAGLASVGALITGAFASTMAKAAGIAATPPQTEGPFYPVKDQVDKDADMTRVTGHVKPALGERIQLNGQLVDAQTKAPIAGALVEFWQACATGRYNHPADTNNAALDPDFQYWAQVRTDATGRFSLLTIKPGAYPADTDWIRPPHIHVKVHQAGYPSLTTQLYFKGESLNDTDHILQAVPKELHELVVVGFSAVPGKKVGNWTILLKKFTGMNPVGFEATSTPEIED